MVGVGIEKGMAPPDVVEFDRGHGRLEVREYWWVKADKDIGWPDVRWYGKVRRERTLLYRRSDGDLRWREGAKPVGKRSLGD